MHSSRRVIGAYLAWLLPVANVHAAPRPISPEDVVSLWRLSDPQIAPDGSQVAFVVSTPDEKGIRRPRLWLAHNDGRAAQEVASGHSASAPRWLPDGRSP